MKRPMRVVVMGASGRLGAAVSRRFEAVGHETFALGRAACDVTRPDEVRSMLDAIDAQIVINCSAYNAVDAAESNVELAFAVNAHAPALLADWTAARGALFVHYSTDFVFDGWATRPYSEDDPTGPLSVYGMSKAAGELEAARCPRHYVLRASSLFGGEGVHGHRTTIDGIADNLLSGRPLRAAVDRTVSPTRLEDLVRVTEALMTADAPYGTYHCVSSGFATWHELAMELARQLQVPPAIESISADDLNVIAPRPRFCALSNEKLSRQGIDLPSWQSAIRSHLKCRPGTRVSVGANAADSTECDVAHDPITAPRFRSSTI